MNVSLTTAAPRPCAARRSAATTFGIPVNVASTRAPIATFDTPHRSPSVVADRTMPTLVMTTMPSNGRTSTASAHDGCNARFSPPVFTPVIADSLANHAATGSGRRSHPEMSWVECGDKQVRQHRNGDQEAHHERRDIEFARRSVAIKPNNGRTSTDRGHFPRTRTKIGLLATAGALTLTLGAFHPSLSYAESNDKTVMVGGAEVYPSKNIIQNAEKSEDHTTLATSRRKIERGWRVLRIARGAENCKVERNWS